MSVISRRELLQQAMTLYGIRVVEKPGGSYATCAELSAYG